MRLEGKINSKIYVEVLQNATIPFIKSLRPKKKPFISSNMKRPNPYKSHDSAVRTIRDKR